MFAIRGIGSHDPILWESKPTPERALEGTVERARRAAARAENYENLSRRNRAFVELWACFAPGFIAVPLRIVRREAGLTTPGLPKGDDARVKIALGTSKRGIGPSDGCCASQGHG